jgi:TonB family protein
VGDDADTTRIGAPRAGHGDPRRYGRDEGKLPSRSPPVAPVIETQRLIIHGTPDREVVRREIRRHLNEIRHCYDVALLRRAGLSGRVAVQFSIDPGGRVLTAAVAQSTMDDARLESCVTAAVRRWAFPAVPRGGLTVVTYPFAFAVAGTP